MLDITINDFLQWCGVLTSGAVALFALGKREQRLTNVEEIAKSANALSLSTANSVAGVEAKLTLMLGMLERIQLKLDRTPTNA